MTRKKKAAASDPVTDTDSENKNLADEGTARITFTVPMGGVVGDLKNPQIDDECECSLSEASRLVDRGLAVAVGADEETIANFIASTQD